jgi:hypothetical protein
VDFARSHTDRSIRIVPKWDTSEKSRVRFDGFTARYKPSHGRVSEFLMKISAPIFRYFPRFDAAENATGSPSS